MCPFHFVNHYTLADLRTIDGVLFYFILFFYLEEFGGVMETTQMYVHCGVEMYVHCGVSKILYFCLCVVRFHNRGWGQERRFD